MHLIILTAIHSPYNSYSYLFKEMIHLIELNDFITHGQNFCCNMKNDQIPHPFEMKLIFQQK